MLLAASVLAQAREGRIGAGALSFLIIVLMGVATALLVRNMNGRLKKLPSSFPPAPDDARPSTGSGGTERPDPAPQG